jgi:hypothetical protein
MNSPPKLILRNVCLGAVLGFLFVLFIHAIFAVMLLAAIGLSITVGLRLLCKGKMPSPESIVALSKITWTLTANTSRKLVELFDKGFTATWSYGSHIAAETLPRLKASLVPKLKSSMTALLEVLSGTLVGGLLAWLVTSQGPDFSKGFLTTVLPIGLGTGALLGMLVIFSRREGQRETVDQPAAQA